MKKIDFKNFKMFTSIDQTNFIAQDVRREIADAIYKNTNGIVAHDLALRIYRSEDPVEINEEENGVLQAFLKGTTPIFMDSFNANIKEE